MAPTLARTSVGSDMRASATLSPQVSRLWRTSRHNLQPLPLQPGQAVWGSSPVGPCVSLQGEIFHLSHRSPVDFLAPAMNLPETHSQMVYFAISDYVFNTASVVYHKLGYSNFSITDDMVRTHPSNLLPSHLPVAISDTVSHA